MLTFICGIYKTFLTTFLMFLLFSVTAVPMAQSQNIFGVYFEDLGNNNFDSFLIDIDATTGIGSEIGSLNVPIVEGLACDANTGTLYAVEFQSFGNDMEMLYTVNPNTGLALPIGLTGFFGIFGLAYDSNTNTLYGIGGADDRLLTLNTATGQATEIGITGLTNVRSLAFDNNTNTLYAIDLGNINNNSLYRINPITASATLIGETGIGDISGLTFDSQTNTLYAALNSTDPDQLFIINTSTGEATEVGDIGFNKVNSLASCTTRQASNVPTLSEWGLIAMAGMLGIVGFMVIRRRRVTA